MSHAEFFAWLFGIATGWLGWSEREALHANMSSILIAYHGRIGMLKAIFGGGEDKAPTMSRSTPENLVAFFRSLKGASQDAR